MMPTCVCVAHLPVIFHYQRSRPRTCATEDSIYYCTDKKFKKCDLFRYFSPRSNNLKLIQFFECVTYL